MQTVVCQYCDQINKDTEVFCVKCGRLLYTPEKEVQPKKQPGKWWKRLFNKA